MIKYLNFKRDIMSELLFLQNSIDGGPGSLVEIAERNGVSYTVVDASRGDVFPDPTEYGAVVMLGDPDSVNNPTDAMKRKIETVATAIEANTPYLGLCLGMQVGVKATGGVVIPSRLPETGFIDQINEPYGIWLTEAGRDDPLFDGLPDSFNVFESHNETVILDKSSTLLGKGQQCVNQAVKLGENAYGLQPHIELTDDMFVQWAKKPPFFAIGYDTLISQANRADIDYARTSETLFTNFLKIAELL